jgi:hypothetical protein
MLHTPIHQSKIRLTLHPGVGRHNNASSKAYGGIIIRNSGALESPLNFPKSRAQVRRRKEE